VGASLRQALWASCIACLVHSPPIRAGTTSVHEVLSRCLERLESKQAPGLKNIGMHCPDLERAVVDSGLANQLDGAWRDTLDAHGLSELDRLAQRYEGAEPRDTPDAEALRTIAQTLSAPVSSSRSRWQRFKDWVTHFFETPEKTRAGWPDQWLSRALRIPRAWQQTLTYASLAGVVLIAAWIVWREVRIARSGAVQARRIKRTMPSVAADADATRPSIGDLENAPPTDRPLVLLRLLVRALVDCGRLRAERSLTHRELARTVVLDTVEQQQCFERVSRLAELRLYGPAPGGVTGQASDDAEKALLDGRRLYAQLSLFPGASA
jgi:hypothetical protein